ncbi:aminotransferase class I/II-fold pyridoxal phosphate-dependent enzyme [Acanthopleuribacter pedis]|uniref:Aminotransferase class I/II-fold pyridoxal phosphate-dependent enzyme n=1 Tax=Acanthopleuribacter pedis TaxID=442870 RepID=A0A8J7QH28_9BACT|nr:aminotransferase class I/II-fold pyridoxal phosphate-dependent enzyme [Acanthopleuribacter pedis]MBO1318458.1 aminotransferase class I/II-fold pyridoxal phosphate-dependent enzyme [Acanthopleuribacter pedis]
MHKQTTPKVFRKRFHFDREYLLAEHTVSGAGILPAAVQLEMILAAGQAFFQSHLLSLRNVTFSAPLVVQPGESEEVALVLEPRERGLVFLLEHQQGDETQTLCSGTLSPAQPQMPVYINMAELCDAQEHRVPSRRIQQWYDNAGISYGPRFRTVCRLEYQSSGDTALAMLVPSGMEAGAPSPFLVEPTLLDGAFQSLGMFAESNGDVDRDSAPFLPFFIKELKVNAPVAGSVYSLLEKYRREGADGSLLQADLKLVGQQGQTMLACSGLVLKRAAAPGQTENAATAPVADTALIPSELGPFFHQMRWAPQSPSSVSTNPADRTIVFCDAQGLGRQLAASLRQQGAEVIEVEPGRRFRRFDANRFMVDPVDDQQFNQLLENVWESGPVQRAFYLWTCYAADGEVRRLSDLELRIEDGGCGFLNLLRTLGSRAKKPVELTLVTQQAIAVEAGEVVFPEAATAWGLARVARQEYRKLNIRALDLPGDWSAEQTAATLLREPAVTESDEIAWRKDRRFAPQLTRVQPSAEGGHAWNVRVGGTYLVTGGLGGLGLTTASWLADQGARTLVLVGRSPLPPEQQWSELEPDHKHKQAVAVINRLRGRGITVLPMSADITNADAVKALVDQVYRKVGEINGIVHAAGVLRDGLIRGKSVEDFLAVLSAKVQGTWLLDQATAELDLDFFLLFSSLSSLLGNLGQADYAAANAYLDSFAAGAWSRNRRVMALNWGPWGEVGMLADRNKGGSGTKAFVDIQPKQGMALIAAALAAPQPHWALFRATAEDNSQPEPMIAQEPVQTLPQEAVQTLPQEPVQTLPQEAVQPVRQGPVQTAPQPVVQPAPTPVAQPEPVEAPTVSSIWEAPGETAELLPAQDAALITDLVALFAESLGVTPAQMNEDSNLLEMGLNSLMVMEVKNKLDTDDIVLEPADFFRHDTVSEFADFLKAEYSDLVQQRWAAPVRAAQPAPVHIEPTPAPAPVAPVQVQPAPAPVAPVQVQPTPAVATPTQALVGSGSLQTNLEAFLIEAFGESLGLQPGQLDRTGNLLELGLNSLMVMEVKNKLESGTDLELDPADFFRFSSVDDLAEFLIEDHADVLAARFAPEPVAAPAPARTEPTPTPAPIPEPAPRIEVRKPQSAFMRQRVSELSQEDIQSKKDGNYFYEPVISEGEGAWVQIGDRRMLVLSSYSYLNLIGHPKINAAAADAIQRFGTGTHGVRLLAGTNVLHRQLEKTIARFKGAEEAIVFSSGYITNVTTVSTLVKPGDVVIGDMYNHASIVDGCRQSGARFLIFGHNDMVDLERCLKKAGNAGKLVVVDAVFSMDGDIINLPEVVRLCQKYDAMLMVDEAHSVGVLGERGHGIEEHFGLDPSCVDIKMGTLSKTIPSVGGYVAGSKELIFAMKHNARAFIFSAALPPAQTAAAMAAFNVIENEPERVARLRRNIQRYLAGLKRIGLNTWSTETSIVPVICKTSEQALEMTKHCQADNLFVQPIIYPAVPINSPRLRSIITACHSEDDIDFALDVLERAAKATGLVANPALVSV